MLFSTRVLKFWVMKTTNIYDFLYFLSLIKIRPYGFWGKFDICTYMPHYNFFFFSLKENGERFTNKDQTKK